MHNLWQRLPRRARRVIVVVSLVIVGGFALDLLSVIGFSLIRPHVPAKVDAVVVLGAKVGTPALRQRTLTGLKYYQTGQTDTLVLSGARGPGEPTTEAQAMEQVIKQQLQQTHQRLPHLILETRSTDTYQNLSNSRALIPNAHSIVVVSDCYHLERSVLLAKRVGFPKVYWDAPKPSYYSDVDLVHYYVREAVAMVVYLPRFL